MPDDDELQRIRETLRRAGIDDARLSDDQLVLVVARLMAQSGPAEDAPGAPPAA